VASKLRSDLVWIVSALPCDGAISRPVNAVPAVAHPIQIGSKSRANVPPVTAITSGKRFSPGCLQKSILLISRKWLQRQLGAASLVHKYRRTI
jgi:hypothetical protein